MARSWSTAAAPGLTVTLTSEVEGFPAGTKIVVADVSASASGAVATPAPTARADARRPSRSTTATPAPTATPKPRKPAGYKKRLMSRRFVFPVGGPTRHRRAVRLLPRADRLAPGQRPVRRLRHAGRRGRRRHGRERRLAEDLRQPAVGVRRQRRPVLLRAPVLVRPGRRQRPPRRGRHRARLHRQHRRRRADAAAPALRDPSRGRRRRRSEAVPGGVAEACRSRA